MYYKYRGFIAALIVLLAFCFSLGYGSLSRLVVAGGALVLGIYFRVWARACIGEHSRGGVLECPTLLVQGAYAHCRHPLYVSSWWIGVSWLLAQKWPSQIYFGAFLALWTAHFVHLSVNEDRFLRGTWGDVWIKYAECVPFWRFAPRLQRATWRPQKDLWTWFWLVVVFALPLFHL